MLVSFLKETRAILVLPLIFGTKKLLLRKWSAIRVPATLKPFVGGCGKEISRALLRPCLKSGIFKTRRGLVS